MKQLINKRLEAVLDKQFPKGRCQERGHALVLFAEAQNIIDGLKSQNKIEPKIKLRIKVCEGFISDGEFRLYLTKEFSNLLKHLEDIK